MAVPIEPRLLDLHRAGELVTRYPEVRAILAGPGTGPPADDRIAAAGRLLSRLDPDDVQREHGAVPSVSVSVTGHGTLAELVPSLTAELARHGLLARPTLLGFDSYVLELGTPGSDLYAARADLTLCVLDATVVLDELPAPWRTQDAAAIAAAKVELLRGLAATYHSVGHGTLVLNTLPLPHRAVAQLVDHRSRARFCATWHEMNAALLRLSDEFSSVVVLDLAPLLAEGIAADDARMSRYAGAHLSAPLLARYAREVGHLARHLSGRTSKVLALDLDGTVWGGILAEDGPGGLDVAEGRTGAAFAAFQRVVKQLGSQGVLLAVVSKNDADAVRAVFRDRTDLTLAETDIVRVVANWRPKHENLTELAEALNLGVDSIVFVDDSPYECGLVRYALPDVAVVPVDADPALHVDALLRDGWFVTRDLTAEDGARVARYREELIRNDFMDSFASIDEYLSRLGILVRLSAAQEADVPRVAQLTLRTNQFNLTTERLQQSEVERLADSAEAEVLTIRSSDRFGEHGIVGVVFVRGEGQVWHIDNFLLSCRVFSRGIEQACLSAVLEHAREQGAREVLGRYRPSPKNGKVKDFYPRNGFTAHTPDSADSAGTLTFRHDLADIAGPPAHLRLTGAIGAFGPLGTVTTEGNRQ